MMTEGNNKPPQAELEKLSISARRAAGPDYSKSSPQISTHGQLNSDIQARVLAFQQKRSKPAANNLQFDNCNDQRHFESMRPLPPLPGQNHPSKLLLDTPTFSDMNGHKDDVLTKSMPQSSASVLRKRPSLSQRRGLKLNVNDLKSPDILSDKSTSNDSLPEQKDSGSQNSNRNLRRNLSDRKNTQNLQLNLNDLEPNQSQNSNDSGSKSDNKVQLQGLFKNYSKYVDIKSGSLNFAGKASLHSKGVDFLSGSLFRISLDELEFIDEIGHGNYGTVLKVLHKPTGVLMAMKEVRLELDEKKFTQILMELDILHKCDSPYIVDFYGAFFVEGAVYMCMEYMDGGSLDKIYDEGDGLQNESCLAYITECVIQGLKYLKDGHNIIHRDVKPTNILISTTGKVKLCDFGVSGNLVASLARTNIGCQSYMAPERIKTMNPDDSTYSVQSDVWSLGLTILEITYGTYPYPAETYGNIFSQLSAIVDGEPPKLDAKIFSKNAQLFVKACLNKNPSLRPSYGTLLKHPWLTNYNVSDAKMEELVQRKKKEHEQLKNQRKPDTRSVRPVPSAAAISNNANALLKNKVRAPAPPLHRGGLMGTLNTAKR